ncbi:unnamed protein product [Closterium sp. NIES-54]
MQTPSGRMPRRHRGPRWDARAYQPHHAARSPRRQFPAPPALLHGVALAPLLALVLLPRAFGVTPSRLAIAQDSWVAAASPPTTLNRALESLRWAVGDSRVQSPLQWLWRKAGALVQQPSWSSRQAEQRVCGEELVGLRQWYHSMHGAGDTHVCQVMDKAREVVASCHGDGMVVSSPVPTWKAYACDATEDELLRYLDYEPRRTCPDDWFDSQDLLFSKNCFALPVRRCLTRTPQQLVEVREGEGIGGTQPAVLYHHTTHPHHHHHLTTRIGLDAGGGTGSFAAHMARYNVTVLTTAMNIETVTGRRQGLPYMETIALRGLIPLHVPHKQRLPLMDNTLDLVHCVNSIKYLPMQEFEELLFDWDRVLRVGGVLWFEMFYAPLDEMPVYVALISALGYKRLYYHVLPKPDVGEQLGAHMYLNCLLEKPVRLDPPKRTGWLF